MSNQLHIVLVHGAWGDASHWAKVIAALHARGHEVSAVQLPLTSLLDDIHRTKQHLDGIDGPVLLVGHSYGGMVISGAGNDAKVVGLVYIAAFAPDEGEAPGLLLARQEPPPGAAIIRPDEHGFLWLDKAQFREHFCQDLDETQALVMARTQKPIAARCFEDAAGAPAWKSKPSWYQVSGQDRMIPPDTQRWFAERMQARQVLELDAGHASLASQPEAVATLIEGAARDVD
ncbi:alpha/beta hydrolase [Gallaecimonas sp. GXIMD4217]|uniref:alpha/beta hydrolase n=1 Tax=Gallaecimonas sp. GXIMD4217 TaxID=3131927 RepID=UPI00311AC612